MNKTNLTCLVALSLLSAPLSTLIAHGDHYDRKQQDERDHRHHAKLERIRNERDHRQTLIEKYRAARSAEVAREVAAGMYADLFKSPAWPSASLFFEGDKNEINVTAKYSYAHDAYSSSGSSSNKNVTQLVFGEKPITFQDVSLVKKLAGQELAARGGVPGTPIKFNVDPTKYGSDYILSTVDHFQDGAVRSYFNTAEPMGLIGRAESYGVSLDYTRYLVKENLACGFELPVVFNKHVLRFASTNLSQATLTAIKAVDVASAVALHAAAAGVDVAPVAELYTYDRFARDVMRAKGFNSLGGTATGLGDMAFFLNGQFDSALWEKLVAGLRIQVPTGKNGSMDKLWAPDLGNGGFSEISVYSNVLVGHSKYINPHLSVQAGFSLPANVNRRVPRKVIINQAAAVVDKAVSTYISAQNLAFSDILTVRNPAPTLVAIDDYDSAVPNMGDNVSRVKITRGHEVKARLGNMMEQLLFRRDFLDVFYDFRAKAKDSATGLQRDVYNVNTLRDHTNQVEHRLGFDYSYQFDLAARLRLGMRYTVGGINVPKQLDAVGSLSYAF